MDCFALMLDLVLMVSCCDNDYARSIYVLSEAATGGVL